MKLLFVFTKVLIKNKLVDKFRKFVDSTANSEKAIYFLSLISKFNVFRFYMKKNVSLHKMVCEEGGG